MTTSVLARIDGFHGFVTEITPSRCPCIDERGSRRPERCDAVACYRRVEVPWCRRLRERKLEDLGVDLSQIATEWGAAPAAQPLAAQPLDRRGRAWTHDLRAELLALKGQGLSNAAIGERMGRTPNAISQELTKLGWRARR